MAPKGWIVLPKSKFPALERAFFELFQGWARWIGYPPAGRSTGNSYEAVVARLLDTIDGDLASNPGYKTMSVPLRSDLNPGWDYEEWQKGVSSRFRRVAQEALNSPTLPKSLKPPKYVVILGAGASVHAGLPLADKLFQAVVKRLRKSFPKSHKYLYSNQNFKSALQRRNIEDVFSVVDLLRFSENAYMKEVKNELEELRKNLVICYRDIIINKQFGRKGGEITRKFIRSFNKKSRGRWSVVSFNQDTVLEVELERMHKLNWKRKNGFGSVFTLDRGDSYEDPLPRKRVYKPHGSVAFYRPREWPLRGLDLDDKAFLRRTPSRTRAPRLKRDLAPLILAPSYFKMYQDEFVQNIIARMVYDILNCTHVISIGFRLRPDDVFVANIIRLALLSNGVRAKRHFTLIGPDAQSDEPGSMGSLWSGTLLKLQEAGWSLSRINKKFNEYVEGL